MHIDLLGTLKDGLMQGLLYAPLTMAMAIIYRHTRTIDLSLDGAATMGQVVPALLLVGGMSAWVASFIGIGCGAAVGLLMGFGTLWLQINPLLVGILVSFVTYALSVMMAGESVSLLSAKTIYQTLNNGLSLSPLLTSIIYCILIKLVLDWMLRTDFGLLYRAVGSNNKIKIPIDPRKILLIGFLVSGMISGLSGFLIAQYRGTAHAGGSFAIIVGALASYVIADSLYHAVGWLHQKALTIESKMARFLAAPAGWISRSATTSRAIFGTLIFYMANQIVIVYAKQPELPKLAIGIILFLILGQWRGLFHGVAQKFHHPRSHTLDTSADAKPFLDIKNVKKGFQRGRSWLEVLRGVTLKFKKETGVVRIRGDNGTGKTTLFRIISGELEPEEGRIVLDKMDITSIPSFRRPVFMVSQNAFDSIAPDLNVMENLCLAQITHVRPFRSFRRNQREKLAKIALDKLELSHVFDSTGNGQLNNVQASHLSGGQAQCLALARAWLQESTVILADEPISNLDPENTVRVMKLLEQIGNRSLVLLISHDKRMDSMVQDDYVLSEGQLSKTKTMVRETKK